MTDPLDALIDKHLPAKTAGADPLDALIDKHLSAYRSPLDSPAGYGPEWLQSVGAHAADNVPFARQIAAALQAAQMKARGSPFDFGENYKQLLTNQEAQLARSKATDPGLSRLGSGLGFVGTAAALPGRGLAQLAGLGGALGLADATTHPDASAKDVAAHTAVSAAAAPILGRAVEAVAPWVGSRLGSAAEYLGGRARDLAGWLKVNSIHPTPTLAEAMDNVPGGAPAVGRELLARGIGGITKAGTAQQIEHAFDGATGTASDLARAFDGAGGAVDLSPALEAAQTRARELISEPARREAGQRLQSLLSQYAERYGAGDAAPASAVDALATKRALGDIGYGAAHEFKLNKNPTVGDYGAGVRQLERGVNSSLEAELGPDFSAANLLVRRLGGAKQAAERAAARTVGNHALGLLPYLAAIGGGAAGHASGSAGPEALAWGLGSLLATKYGAQAGARILYSPVGGGLGLMGRGISALPASFAARLAAEEASPLASGSYVPQLARPAMANRENEPQRSTLAQLLQGAP